MYGIFWFDLRFFLTVCSLTREERRKRNVGGIVCGDLKILRFRKEYGGTFFLEKMLIPDLMFLMLANVIDVRLVCKNMFSSIQA